MNEGKSPGQSDQSTESDSKIKNQRENIMNTGSSGSKAVGKMLEKVAIARRNKQLTETRGLKRANLGGSMSMSMAPGNFDGSAEVSQAAAGQEAEPQIEF